MNRIKGNPFSKSPQLFTVKKFGLCAACLMVSQVTYASLAVTDGGFEELPNAALADGGTVKTTLDNWYDDEGDAATVGFSSFIFHFTGEVGETQLLALGKNAGYVYQSLGTRASDEDSLTVTLDAFERKGTTSNFDRFFPTLNIDFYAGSFGGAANAVDIDGSLTSIGTLTLTGGDLFTTPTDGSDGESQLGFTLPGSVDLSGEAIGTEIWIRLQTPDATGNTSAAYIDNLSVAASAIPEPSVIALLGLAILLLRRRH